MQTLGETILSEAAKDKKPMWKLMLRVTWAPYVLMFILLTWIVINTQNSQIAPKQNAIELKKIEDVLNDRGAIIKSNDEKLLDLQRRVSILEAKIKRVH